MYIFIILYVYDNDKFCKKQKNSEKLIYNLFVTIELVFIFNDFIWYLIDDLFDYKTMISKGL